MKIVAWVILIAVLPTMALAEEAACNPPTATLLGFARPTLGIFAADGTYTDKEIPTSTLVPKDIKVCAWNKERNLMRLVFEGKDIWVDAAELNLKLGDRPQDDSKLACANAPSTPTGTQALASMGVNGAECKKKD
jgi:hypothetical protein